jgi:hypothetical protein
MSKIIFLFFPFLVFGFDPLKYWWIDDIIYLKKDYPAIYKIYYKNQTYVLKFRWTLYKNKGLVMLYNYNNFPYQNILYKTHQLNGFKKFIRWKGLPNSPYFMIYLRDFSQNVAKFEFLIYNPKKNIQIKLNEPRYRDKKWVINLTPLYQKAFEREIK